MDQEGCTWSKPIKKGLDLGHYCSVCPSPHLADTEGRSLTDFINWEITVLPPRACEGPLGSTYKLEGSTPSSATGCDHSVETIQALQVRFLLSPPSGDIAKLEKAFT